MRNKKILNLTLFSTFSAIILLIGLIPEIGYITFIPGIASITIVHIPVLIGITLLPLSYAAGLGLMFGLTSFIASFIYAKSTFDYAFQNPLISILPRILFAVIAFLVINGLKKLLKNIKHSEIYAFTIVSFVSIVFMFFVAEGLLKLTNWERIYVYLGVLIITVVLLFLYYLFLRTPTHRKLAYIPTSFIVSSLIHSLLVLTLIALFKPTAYGDNPDLFGLILAIFSSNSLVEALAAILIGTPIVVALHNVIEIEELK